MGEEAKITFRLPQSLKDQLKTIAAKEDRTVSGQVLHWLKAAVRRYGKGGDKAI